MAVTEFSIYLDSLVGSWRALAVPQSGAEVVEGVGFVAARFPTQPVLDNALLLQPDALPVVSGRYRGVRRWAVWTCSPDTAAVVRAAGFVPDETTYPMIAELADVSNPDGSG